MSRFQLGAAFVLTFATLASAVSTQAYAATPLALVAGPASVDGDKVLAALDERAAVFKDQSYRASMEIFKGTSLQKTLVFQAQMRGLDQQLLEFLEPGDVAGMKVLMQDAQTLYVYMPEFKKVRRVAAHAMNQGFLGSTFTYEDMTQVRLAPYFSAKLEGQQGDETTLVLTPKEGVDVSFASVVAVVSRKEGGITKLTYRDSNGQAVREQTRTDWVSVKGTRVPTKVTMRDLKTGDHTVVTRKNLEVDQGLDDGIFSRRTLLR